MTRHAAACITGWAVPDTSIRHARQRRKTIEQRQSGVGAIWRGTFSIGPFGVGLIIVGVGGNARVLSVRWQFEVLLKIDATSAQAPTIPSSASAPSTSGLWTPMEVGLPSLAQKARFGGR
jgi:hypothetical protein